MKINNENPLYDIFSNDDLMKEATGKTGDEIYKEAIETAKACGGTPDPFLYLLAQAQEKYEEDNPDWYDESVRELEENGTITPGEYTASTEDDIAMWGWHKAMQELNRLYLKSLEGRKFIRIPNKEKIKRYMVVKNIFNKIISENPGTSLEENKEELRGEKSFFGIIVGGVGIKGKSIVINDPNDLLDIISQGCSLSIYDQVPDGVSIGLGMGSLTDEIEITNKEDKK